VLEQVLLQGREGVEIGLAVGVETDVAVLEPLLQEVSVVQCMGIARIGYQGEAFAPEVIDSVERLRSMDKDVIISVDGGVSLQTAPRLVAAGANRLVSGSAVFAADNTAAAISQLQSIA
jgi:ribulose-phosphate 3-epimerase